MILGISLSHDGTLALLDDDGNVIYAVGEERINRIKCYTGFPFEALENVFLSRNYDPKEIKAVAVGSHSEFIPQMAETFSFLLTRDKTYYDLINDRRPDNYDLKDDEWSSVKTVEECRNYVERKLKGLLSAVGIDAPIYFVNHHLSHAASAYFASGFKKTLAITIDGEGDFESSTVSLCEDGVITRIHTDSSVNSIGNVYSYVTKDYGFKISRHEGKITGLAAYGNPNKQLGHFKKYVSVGEFGDMRIAWKPGFFRSKLDNYKLRRGEVVESMQLSSWENIVRTMPKGDFPDAAAAVQKLLEDLVAKYVGYWMKKTKATRLVLAGGVFANVKLNQRILDLEEVQHLFIYPNMGDGGLAYGAARYVLAREFGKTDAKRIDHVYYGDTFELSGLEKLVGDVDAGNFEVLRPNNLEGEVAKLLADGAVVGWFQGNMEYGPRALGHRSVIASPVDKNINKWLNERMHRTEFMPFAPSCLYEAADELFVLPKDSGKFPAEFMTITFDMRPEWIARAPAVAHVDGTARPQLVRKETNPQFHKVIESFREITGLPLVINTSFNAHEEPIVRKPAEAINALAENMIDALAIGPWLIVSRHRKAEMATK